MRLLVLAFALAVSLIVLLDAACSSGGGGGGGATPSAASPAPITLASAPVITARVVDTSLVGISVGTVGGGGGSAGGGSSGGVALRLGAGALTARGVRESGPEVATRVVIPPFDEDCLISGFATISGNIADPQNFPQPGDQVTTDFHACDEGEGFVVDGRLDLRLVSLIGDFFSDEVDVTFDALMIDFRITEEGSTVTANGDSRLRSDTTVPLTSTIEMSGNSLKLGVATETLLGYDLSLVLDESEVPEPYELESNGRLTSSEFEGEAAFQTTQTFEGTGIDPPSSGMMVITGADDATITLVALGDDDIRLDIDLDGDGEVDEMVFTTWQDLP